MPKLDLRFDAQPSLSVRILTSTEWMADKDLILFNLQIRRKINWGNFFEATLFDSAESNVKATTFAHLWLY